MILRRRNAIVFLAAGAAFVLGYAGYRSVPGARYSATDAAYWSLTMFYAHVGSTPGGTPWPLDVGRFLALAVVAYAAVAAVALLLRDRWDGWWVRRFARGHALVIGSAPIAMPVVDTLTNDGLPVVVGDLSPRSRVGVGLRASGARLVAGDATQSSIMRGLRVPEANLVVIATGDDARNLESLDVAIGTLEPGAARKPSFHVVLDDVKAWRELSHTEFAGRGEVAVEFFNAADRAALVLVDAATELTGGELAGGVLIDGSGPVAVRTVVHIVRRSLLAGAQPEIRLSSETGPRLEIELSEQEPWCLEAADVRCAVASDPTAALAMAVGAATDAAGLARGASLVRTGSYERVVVAVEGARWADGLRRTGIAPAGLYTVSIGPEVLAAQLIEASGVEIIARARHDDYVRRALERGESPGTNTSLVAWDLLPDSLKESNRRFAESVATHVAALGARLRPVSHAPTDVLATDGAILDELAEREHERWVSALEADGWRYTPGVKDPEAKLHPLLVPWDELSEADRDKDRDVFRGLPRMLAFIGYELVLPTESPAGGFSPARGAQETA